MGLDQRRKQIAAERIDTIAARSAAPGSRPGTEPVCARSVPRFGTGHEVALEATSGSRFVVEELEDARRTKIEKPSRHDLHTSGANRTSSASGKVRIALLASQRE
jgi:hypothetical protein